MVDHASVQPALQHTLAAPLGCCGIGLHTGRHVAMTVLPAPAGTGIVFRRVGANGRGAEIRALWENSVDLPMCQSLSGNGVRVRTVEHLMAAFYACAVDNAVVELDGEEVPIMDGSARPFVDLIEAAGVREQEAPRSFVRVLEPITLDAFGRHMTLTPADALELDVTINLKHVGEQRWDGPVDPAVLRTEVAAARAFGRLKLSSLAAALANRVVGYPLLRGAGLGNVLAIVGSRVLNPGGLRMPDEFVRHRIVDIVGDLYLAGGPILGRLTIDGAGHRPIRALLFELFATDGAWRRVTRDAA